MSERRSRTAFLWIWISVLIILLDQWSKLQVSTHMQLHESYDLTSFMRLMLAHNQGASFSMLGDSPKLALYLFSSIASMVVLGLLFWLFCLPASSRWLSVSITLILGGAIGNLIDRVRFGHVIDFIDIYVNQWHWPTFNIADSAICVGAVMIIIDAIWLSSTRVKE